MRGLEIRLRLRGDTTYYTWRYEGDLGELIREVVTSEEDD